MSTDVLQKTNKLLEATTQLREFLAKFNPDQLWTVTNVNWAENTLIDGPPELRRLLISQNEAYDNNEQIKFGRAGRALLGKLLLDLDGRLKSGLEIDRRYRLDSKLVAGKNSITYRAHDLRLGRQVVIKFFRPGRGEGIIQNIVKLGHIRSDPYLVNPTDVLDYVITDAKGHSVRLDVLIFPFVDGMTFRDYILREKNSSPTVIQAFIEQTAIALNALESAGLNHGDLHSNNIMVTTEPSDRVAFRVIDVSYGADKPSDYEFPADDFQGYKFILHLALEEIQKRLTKISLRRFLGARIYTLVEYILGSEKLTFAEIIKEVESGDRFTAFNQRKNAFLAKQFRRPRDFGILRYEEIEDPNTALRLFYPYPELFKRLCEFGSAVLFGHRGTGKSTYLAAITFFPEAEKPRVDFRKTFGVLFSCRQGEFRKFSSRHFHVTNENRLSIKDILIKKIIRKTLRSLASGIAKGIFQRPVGIEPIAEVLLPRLQLTPGLMLVHQVSEIESLCSTVLQAEINAVDRLFAGESKPALSKLLDEGLLTDFFSAIRAVFSDLNQARFFVLFDDAGAPNVSREMQSLICDLMASTNSIYCVKVSAEKKTFELETSDNKAIERIHDVRAFTISDYLYLGGGISPERRGIEEYFRELVAVRLKVCGFESSDIRHYLGDELVKVDELVLRLASNSGRKPKYCGWQMVWQIADRTARHLLEMISTILDAGKIVTDKPPRIVDSSIQSKQIVRFSEDKLRGLMFLPGTVEVEGRKMALGKRLYEFATSFGRVSRFYLLRSASELKIGHSGKQRFDERLAIEIDNTLTLSADAQRMLNELIRFAIVDDEQMAQAFDDGTRKPIYIFNRVYCPFLGISFRRFSHWRLSSKRFNEFLVDPTDFVRSDERLKKLDNPNSVNEGELFQ
jgi:serine/threonine protein kinase